MADSLLSDTSLNIWQIIFGNYQLVPGINKP